MSEKRYNRMTNHYGTSRTYCTGVYDNQNNRELKNASQVITELNALHEENEELKKELKVYRKVASCGNCHYHNYEWFDDGDEFEVCDKGNDVTDGICEEWREL